jgi:predicted lipoprotein with Yx(FWY)xxD motif
MTLRRVVPVAVVLAGLLSLSACSVFSHSKDSTPKPVASAAAKSVTTADQVVKLAAARSAALGDIVTDQSGFTLYRFEKDSIAPPSSNCANQCALTWPPAIVTTTNISLAGISNSLVGTITRTDGAKQLTIGGHPVYRYVQDTAPGETKGQGVGQTWFAVTPTGGQASSVPTGATLSTAQSSTLGTIVTDADGFTLYRFDNDTANPSKTNCVDACAKTWPPAVVTSNNVTLSGVDKSVVGTVLRPDGSRQLTIGGWPVYEFSKDTAQGDVNGQGVKGTWFAVTPTGQKNTTGVPAAQTGATAPAAAATPTTASGY